jgi:hypothetical protein
LIPLRELIALLGLPRFSPARLAAAFGLLIVAVGLAIAGFVELMEALYLYLLQHLSPPVAKLLIGLALLLLAGALCLIARRLTRPLPPRKRPTTVSGDASAEALAWVRRHPGQSAVLAAVLGFCAGAWPEARKAMSDLAKTQR